MVESCKFGITMDSSGYTNTFVWSENLESDLEEANQNSLTKRWVEEIFVGTFLEAKNRAQEIAFNGRA